MRPGDIEALLDVAAAAMDEGRFEQAAEAFAQCLTLDREDLELAWSYAELLIGPLSEERERVVEGVALCAKSRRRAAKRSEKELELDFLVLEGVGRNLLGENKAALELFDLALERMPDHLDAQVERGLALFELCRFEEAKEALERAEHRSPEDPWIPHTLGLIAERRGETKDAQRLFARARKLAPEELPAPVDLDDEAFDHAVEDALRKLPENVKHYLENVAVAVEPFPPTEELTSSEPPLSPSILGMFRGTPIGERSVTRSEDHTTAAIVLYQKNLERFARTREELIEQIGITVMHEFGHLIGLDEDDLWERGLD